MKRKYSRSLSFIEAGFRACIANAGELVGASKLLFEAGYHATALSVSTLALEEMGKLFLIDGLLFSNNDSQKTEFFNKSLRSHNVKLAAIGMLPWLCAMLAKQDARFEKDPVFRTALIIGHKNWDQAGQEVIDLSGQENFEFLDKWKQSGFYVSLINGSKFQTPEEGVDRMLADKLVKFAEMSIENIRFSAGDATIHQYFALAEALRSKLSDEDHEAIEANAESLMAELFP